MATKTYLYKKADGDNSKRAKLTDVSNLINDNSSNTPIEPQPLAFGITAETLIAKHVIGTMQLDSVNNIYKCVISKNNLGLDNDADLTQYEIIALQNTNDTLYSMSYDYIIKNLTRYVTINISSILIETGNRENANTWNIVLLKK